MEIKEMTFDELQTRKSALAEELKTADMERLDGINAELDAIEERKAELKAEVEERAKVVEEVINAPNPTPITEERKMDTMDINSKEYLEAYAEYLKAEAGMETRDASPLLTINNENGTVAVPSYVEERIRTAWENDEIMRRVSRLFVKGNLKVGYEISSSPAQFHTEGGNAIGMEDLQLGIVELIPQMAKKWIQASDEVLSLKGQSFIDYLFDELEYRIIKLCGDTVVDKIEASSLSETATATDYKAMVLAGITKLSDEASNVVAIMNRTTYASIRSAVMTANYGFDAFEGLPVIFNEAVANDEVIVGDLKGVTANFPDGDQVKFIIDDKTLMTSDMVRILGKLYVAIEVTAPGRFTVVTKTA